MIFTEGKFFKTSAASSKTNIDIVGQVYEAKNVLHEIQRLLPELIFLDINLPDKNGIELAGEVLKKTFLP